MSNVTNDAAANEPLDAAEPAQRYEGTVRDEALRAQARTGKTFTVRINRGESGDATGHWENYEVDLASGMVVLDAVLDVQKKHAPDMAVRWNCKAAKCGSCSAEINGRPRLMCKTRVEDLDLEQPVLVQPMQSFPRIKDLVTNVSWNYRINEKIVPFKPRTDRPWKFYQKDVEKAQQMRECIECFLCQDVCHVLRYTGEDKPQFFGPRFFVRSAGLDFHPMDAEDRVGQLRGEGGIGLCNITKCCTEVCPAGIHITDDAIIPEKERVVDAFDDPLRRLFRRKDPAKVES
jgi:succinate dehydrogenase / fumarate reductase iron-sulfur subunit